MDTRDGRESKWQKTVGDIGEFGIIDRATRGRVQSEHTLLGPGDDAAVLAAPDGRVVVTTDMLVEGRHFRLDWSDPTDVGRKAIAQNGADIAAMGARCTGFFVALGCPADTSVDVIDGVTDGLWREATRAGASIAGGDLVQSSSIVISITALGDLEGRPPVLRSGASVGDVVAVTGRLGYSAAGYAVLEAGLSGHEGLVDAHRVPTPDYPRGAEAALAGATSLTDVSDGLLADLGHIADASGVRIDVSTERVHVPDDIGSAATQLNARAIDWVLTGGEDHALAATFPPGADIPPGWDVVGQVYGGDGVTVDGETFVGESGWSSFGTASKGTE